MAKVTLQVKVEEEVRVRLLAQAEQRGETLSEYCRKRLEEPIPIPPEVTPSRPPITDTPRLAVFDRKPGPRQGGELEKKRKPWEKAPSPGGPCNFGRCGCRGGKRSEACRFWACECHREVA